MYNLDSLIDLCIAGEENKVRWKQCIEHYKLLFVMLRKKDDFSDDQIIDFQREADYFYKIWIDIHGAKGVTNYIHMIGSGHVADFLEYYRNLYRHSQQGWENFNSFLKVYFFRRTMRGGGRNNGSKLEPMAKWLARRMVCMSGVTYRDMKWESTRINQSNNGTNDDTLEDDDEMDMDSSDSNNVLAELDMHDHTVVDIDQLSALEVPEKMGSSNIVGI
jgi:hypothetical protein